MQLPAVSSRDNFQVYLDQVLENRIKRTGSAMDKAKETKLQSPFRDLVIPLTLPQISGQETLLGGKSFSLDEMFSIKPDPTLADSQSDSFPSLTYEVDEQCPKTATLNENLEMGKDQFGFNQDFQAEDYDL
ncbi:hypothetical protein E3P92_00943 [Wallemia ichthyophaga]|uniref:Uncharacterized protein n=1 Tax=Wallemia ichthyophaga TaxID=245174 RepID=A0A4T0HI48_WALIC|nr:hypothetical protein E3P91_01815 [Wallemia ichthyophaga]TIA81352.1 hypothetical protein E3P98_02053 [Wallemia ichthyophaga]TIA93063.1 hypothetical protein E3P97_01075 [Wallemia ichthyophaga]TIB02336.1 hypothetical protein E3P95_00896 [Wallemia ichthyophaga]TIB03287.1 hypothetical protein E3P94_01028 [Wallemia ichthyophaga]